MYPSVAEGHEYVVFDFDGTLAEDSWPKPVCGEPITGGVAMLRFYYDQGYACVINTARPKRHAEAIWRWLRKHKLDHMVYDVICGKPIAGLYIDDRAFRFAPEKIVDIHKRRGKLTSSGVYVCAEGCSLTTTGVCSCR